VTIAASEIMLVIVAEIVCDRPRQSGSGGGGGGGWCWLSSCT
jgi:hypothetical protein